MPQIVNAVGGGDLKEDISLSQLSEMISGDEVRYDPEYWPGLYIRFTPDSPAVLVFHTGKYNIAGAESIEDLNSAKQNFLDTLEELGIEGFDSDFEVRNLVFLDRYSRELELEQIAVALGLESTEYDPEDFPGLLYRPEDVTGTFLVFRNGKVILTGANNRNAAESAFQGLFFELDALFE